MILDGVGKLGGFCMIHCNFGEFHLQWCELENGLQILHDLQKERGFLVTWGGVHGFLTVGMCANAMDFASFII